MRPCYTALIFAVVACGDATSLDAPHVDDLPVLTLVETLRIGNVDDPDTGFSQIRRVISNDDGRVYVLESQDRHVRVYDAAGALLRVIGGPGEGPGEFRSPFELGLVGDTLWVHDVSLHRLTLFTTDGELLRAFTLPRIQIEPAPGIVGYLEAASVRSDGFLESMASIPVLTDAQADSFYIPTVRFDTTGAIVDTIRMQRRGFSGQRLIPVGGSMLGAPVLGRFSRLEVNEGDHVFAIERPLATDVREGRFVVTHLDASGDTIFRRQFRYRPRPFEAAFVDSVIAARAASAERLIGVDADAAAAAFRAAIEVPPWQSTINSARTGADTVLWLERDEGGIAARRWLLIAPNGDPVGSLEIPRNITVHWSRGDIVWAVVRDDLDVQWLVRYQLRPAGSLRATSAADAEPSHTIGEHDVNLAPARQRSALGPY